MATGNERKTNLVDAHSAARRSPSLRRVQTVPVLIALGLLVDRCNELGRARTETLNRIHRLLLELVAGAAKRFSSARQARAAADAAGPRDPANRVRRRLAVD
ncbi:hypothetical protein [Nocardia sp. NPDC005998]|uniref:hypothetical protein n=1 Tax=Nocardia sp. NPDC005998 TaxID=3156894 RepID=UPI0033A1EA39